MTMSDKTQLVEEWRPIPDYEGRYEVSNLGRVKSLPNSRRFTEMILKLGINKKYPHRYVNLTSLGPNGKWVQKAFSLHRLVAKVFIPNPGNKPQALHGPNGPSDNSVSNLYWGDGFNNMADRERDGTVNRGSRNGQAVLTPELVAIVKERLRLKESQSLIADYVGCARTTIAAIAQGRTWSHVS
jgi:hypothetical protein